MIVDEVISIHTPAKGVTSADENGSGFWTISIHTPAKGVTSGSCRATSTSGYFNPHTREGCDVSRDAARNGQPVFQSTHPRRV